MASIARQIIFKILSQIQYGKITLLVDNIEHVFSGQQDSLCARIKIHSDRLFRRIIFSGTNGAAWSYINGEWETDDLTSLIEIILKNKAIFSRIDNPFSNTVNTLMNFFNAIAVNHKIRSKKNILQHYDLSNEFFSLILDKEMMYSCGVYPHENASLDEASTNKLKLIANALQLNPSDHLLEIGSGWGGFAIFAAQHYGCKVTTTTISDQQYAHVKQQVQQLNLQNQIEVLNQDYRELQGQYDKVVSIEMIEAVGHHFFNTFFKKCNALVKPGGLFFLQSITINDQAYAKAKNEIDFIKKYIFPGGCLPSQQIINKAITENTSMQLLQLQDIGRHYFKTVKDWQAKFYNNFPAIRKLGFSESFIRTWDFYFSYCAAGFQQSYISNIQGLWQKQS